MELSHPTKCGFFLLLVKRQSKTWPESRQRQSQWFGPEKALSAIKEESLRELLSIFAGNLNIGASPSLRVRPVSSFVRTKLS
jgi:hypothetical protein